MHIILNNSSMIPIYEQLMEQIKNEIISGGLKEGEALPSVRTLSGEGNLCHGYGHGAGSGSQTACGGGRFLPCSREGEGSRDER